MIATKLWIPRVPREWVPRERLLDRVDAGIASRLTLLSAPPGFGKTTLLASWLATRRGERAVAWLALDAADSDPAVLWSGVATALRAATSTSGPRDSGLPARLDATHDATQDATQDATIDVTPDLTREVTVPAVLNYLADTPGEVLLVLDDYHLVDHPPVATGMAELIEHLPPHAHVLLCTRADPDLPLARWRARGDLVEIRARDLRFTTQEATAYLTGALATPLTTEDMATLATRTEGWIAALQLAAISVRERTDVSGFIADFAGDNRFVVDYLVEEVLSQQPPDVRDFLLRTSVLDQFCMPLCNAVLERDDSAGMLRTLERANLFLVELDDRREWFRYHHLFADVLRARLGQESPDIVPLLHERASRWFEGHAWADPAIRHTLAAGNVTRAAALIEAAIPAVRRNREEALARTWLAGLPAHVIGASPALAVLAAGLAMLGGDLATVRTRLDDADRALAAFGDLAALGDLAADPALDVGRDVATDRDLAERGHGLACPDDDVRSHHRTLLATVAIYRAALAQGDGNTPQAVRHARRALAIADPTDHLSRGAAEGFLGLSAWADGDVQQALVTFGHAVTSLYAGGNVLDGLSGQVVLADLWRAAGRPMQARRVCEEALRAAGADPSVGRAVADVHVALAELDIEAHHLAAAGAHLDAATTWSRRTAMTESISRHFVAEALLARLHGDRDAAERHLDQAARLYRSGFVPDLRPIPSLRARWRIRDGDLATAYEWARERAVTPDDEADPLREFDHLTLVRLLFAEHRLRPTGRSVRTAMALLARLQRAAADSGRTGALVEIGLLTALGHDQLGRRADAVATLASVWGCTTEPQGYVRIFLDEGGPMRQLLHALERDAVVGHHARRVLASATGASPAGGGSAPGGGSPADGPSSGSPAHAYAGSVPLSAREVQVLRLLDSDLSGPEIARTLFISPNTVRTHIKHIFTKLDVSSRRAAVLRAREWGVLPAGSD